MTKFEPIKSKLDLKVLNPFQLEQIREATLDVLENVGVRFPSEQALRLFMEHGIPVDEESHLVKLPAEFVLQQMANAPRKFILSGRNPGTELELGNGQSYFATDGCGVETIDFESGERRLSCKEDVAKMALVSDYLTSISFYWPMVSAQDYRHLAPLHELDASFRNTEKHVQTETVMGENLARYAVEIAQVIAGNEEMLREKPPLSSLICTIAPLCQDKEGIEAAMVFAAAGIPVGFMAMPTMGSTAPAVPGGALVVGNAEAVSAMVLMQLVNPGAPVFQSLLVSAMDPQTAEYLITLPEKYLCNVAAVQMAHDWGVPALAGTFGLNHTEPATWQLGRDSVYTALMCSLAGTDITIGLGLLDASTLLIPEQIIFDDEIYHIHRLLAQGLDTGTENLASEIIEGVGPGGNYLSQKHTRDHMREIWIPGFTHPRTTSSTVIEGDLRRRARAKLDQILAEHAPQPLEEAVAKEIEKILIKAGEEINR